MTKILIAPILIRILIHGVNVVISQQSQPDHRKERKKA